MQTVLVFLVYGFSLALAVYLLYRFHAKAWYWHTLSTAAAIGLGLVPMQSMPLPAGWADKPVSSFVVGAVFTFLLVWGIGAPFFREHRVTRHA